jgi:hypothetical protein
MPEARGPWREVAFTALAAAMAAAAAGLLCGVDPGYFWRDDCQIWGVPTQVELLRAWHAGDWPTRTQLSWQATTLLAEYQPGVLNPLVGLANVLAGAVSGGAPARLAAVGAAFWLAVTAAGAFRLARREGLEVPLATLVAAVGTFSGWSMTWGATNWQVAQVGFGCLTWALWALTGAARGGGWLLAALAVALLLTAGWPLTVVMAGLVTVVLLLREGPARALGPLSLAWLVGLAWAAPALLPFVAHAQGSLRAQVSAVWQWQWLVPLQALPALWLPSFVSSWQVFGLQKPHVSLELANGLVPSAVLLAACARRLPALPRPAWAWAGLALGVGVLACLPSVGMFRWSFRWLPLFHLAAAMAAALWLQASWRARAAEAPLPWVENPGMLGALAVGLTWVVSHPIPGVVGPLAAVSVAGALAWAAAERWGTPPVRAWAPLACALVVLGATYRLIPTALDVPTWPLWPALDRAAPLEPGRRYLALATDQDYFEVGAHQPGFGQLLRPGQTPLLAGLSFVNGYTPLPRRGIWFAFQFGPHGYVSAPALRRVVTRDAQPGGLLSRLGVDGLVLGPQQRHHAPGLVAMGWQVIAEGADGVALHRSGPLAPLAASVPGIRHEVLSGQPPWWLALGQTDGLSAVPAEREPRTVELFAPRAVQLRAASRGAVDVEVAAGPDPGLVAVRVPWLDGWEATLAGRRVSLVSLDGIVVGARIPAGVGGTLQLRYWPPGLRWGAALALGVTVLVLGGLGWRRRRPRAVG